MTEFHEQPFSSGEDFTVEQWREITQYWSNIEKFIVCSYIDDVDRRYKAIELWQTDPDWETFYSVFVYLSDEALERLFDSF